MAGTASVRRRHGRVRAGIEAAFAVISSGMVTSDDQRSYGRIGIERSGRRLAGPCRHPGLNPELTASTPGSALTFPASAHCPPSTPPGSPGFACRYSACRCSASRIFALPRLLLLRPRFTHLCVPRGRRRGSVTSHSAPHSILRCRLPHSTGCVMMGSSRRVTSSSGVCRHNCRVYFRNYRPRYRMQGHDSPNSYVNKRDDLRMQLWSHAMRHMNRYPEG